MEKEILSISRYLEPLFVGDTIIYLVDDYHDINTCQTFLYENKIKRIKQVENIISDDSDHEYYCIMYIDCFGSIATDEIIFFSVIKKY